MKRTTALLSLFLTVLLLTGLFPVSVQAADDPFPAEYATLLDESVLETTFAEKTKGLFLSEELSEYAYNAIRYHIRSKTNDYRVAKNLLQLYKSVDGNVIFFFDGCSANLKGSVPVKSGYSYDVKKNRYNMSAVCLVVRADQEGRPFIAYATKDAATMADNVRKESLNGGTPVSITKDGIYNILAVNHQGKYGALNIQTTAGSGVRCSEKGASALNARGSGINIHSRGYGDPNLIKNTTRSSTGCFNIGRKKNNDDFNAFMYASTGLKNAYTNTFTKTKTSLGVALHSTVGITIVDRSNYIESLKVIYGDDNPSAKGAKTADQIVSAITAGSVQWHNDIVTGSGVHTLRITSPANRATVDCKNGLSLNWLPAEDAAQYHITVEDLTGLEGQKGPYAGYFIYDGTKTSRTIRQFRYPTALGSYVNNGTFINGHRYRITIDAYDENYAPLAKGEITITAKWTEEEAPTAYTPSRDIILLLDGSGSMSDTAFAEMLSAAEAFAEQVLADSGKTRIAMAAFGDDPAIFFTAKSGDSGFYDNLTDIRAALANGYRDYGMTPISDALLRAEEKFAGSTAERKIILLLSDGDANEYSAAAAKYGTSGPYSYSASNNAYNIAAHLVNDDDIYIYTLGFDLWEGGDAEQLLQGIADLHGCTYTAMKDVSALRFSFLENADDIRLNGSQILIRIACPVEVYVSYADEILSSDPAYPSYATSFGTLEVDDAHEVKTLRLDASRVYETHIYGTGDGVMQITVEYPGTEKESIVFTDVPVTTDSAFLYETGTGKVTLYVDNDGVEGYDTELRGTRSLNGERTPDTDPDNDRDRDDDRGTNPFGDGTMPRLFRVTMRVGEGGAVNVPDAFTIAFGATRTIRITPNDGYTVTAVVVNGKSVGAVTEYTLTPAVGDSTVEVTFAPIGN